VTLSTVLVLWGDWGFAQSLVQLLEQLCAAWAGGDKGQLHITIVTKTDQTSIIYCLFLVSLIKHLRYH
jgi:hypothetical protein